MSTLSIILLLLRVADSLFSYLRSKQEIDAGVDKEIARTTAAILTKTQAAQEIMREVTKMTDDQVDKALKELEP